MLRRTLLKLFTISPVAWVLAALKMELPAVKNSYFFRTEVPVLPESTTVTTANPQKDRDRLPDLWAEHRSLVERMVEKSLELANSQDTRGWTVRQWNDELEVTKVHWQMDRQWQIKRSRA
jgi:hypothetical protein